MSQVDDCACGKCPSLLVFTVLRPLEKKVYYCLYPSRMGHAPALQLPFLPLKCMLVVKSGPLERNGLLRISPRSENHYSLECSLIMYQTDRYQTKPDPTNQTLETIIHPNNGQNIPNPRLEVPKFFPMHVILQAQAHELDAETITSHLPIEC